MQTPQFEITPSKEVLWHDKENVLPYLKSLPEGKYSLMAVKDSGKRSLEQNNLLWRRYEQIAAHLNTTKLVVNHETGEQIECTAEMVHNFCKNVPELNALLPKKYAIFTDKDGVLTLKEQKGTTTKLTKQGFSDYYEAVGAYWLERLPTLKID